MPGTLNQVQLGKRRRKGQELQRGWRNDLDERLADKERATARRLGRPARSREQKRGSAAAGQQG